MLQSSCILGPEITAPPLRLAGAEYLSGHEGVPGYSGGINSSSRLRLKPKANSVARSSAICRWTATSPSLPSLPSSLETCFRYEAKRRRDHPPLPQPAPVWKSTSRHRVDGVEDNAMIQLARTRRKILIYAQASTTPRCSWASLS